ncbi:hypothetical protein UFOVP1146_402 [uncultured Caudovirales phage]|uniref:Uncharacterized protein n=1 Tax=uncultured Caudovirales phage TaxID=2100421 RepID=A0A6J5P262_9CAUD|nr:hypothetical protein UFOVP812_315 [uncultured Caudovirales phage]CAB4165714.1 hypothetical protein UFOVP818_250 [uncultured Caudovirales phage]CAB4187056.1 hypothetical protein UFOVP1146_402 [uncultured Caudovirales phage]CAB4221122.1 hypothetical protein UFOVP1638_163 [uncultured Caudovirales phage]
MSRYDPRLEAGIIPGNLRAFKKDGQHLTLYGGGDFGSFAEAGGDAASSATESAADVDSAEFIEVDSQSVSESLDAGGGADQTGYEVVDQGMTPEQFESIYGEGGTTDAAAPAEQYGTPVDQPTDVTTAPDGPPEYAAETQQGIAEAAKVEADFQQLRVDAAAEAAAFQAAHPSIGDKLSSLASSLSTKVSDYIANELPKQLTTLAKNQLVAAAKSVVTSTLGNTPAGRAAAAALNKGIDKTAKAVDINSTGGEVFAAVSNAFGVTTGPAAAVPQGTAFDDNGNLNLGWTLNEFDQPVFIGGGFVDSTGKFLSPPPNAVNPATASIFGLTLNDAYDAATGALKEGWQILSGKAVNVAEALAGGLTVLKAVDGTPYLADKDGVPVTAGSFLNAAATASLPQFGGTGLATIAASNTAVGIALAQKQQTLAAQRLSNATTGDWRVRLSLAPNASYLYNAAPNGTILAPLRNTDGVIFPYTPTITTSYKAEYTSYDLTHSNFRGYFYKSSTVEPIDIKAIFTAQDTAEANYLLAVIHFFRSVTKMFYGQDANRGAPPPLVFLSGLGQYQFNKHPCVVSSFQYSLPAEVNYIRSSATFDTNGTSLLTQRENTSSPNNALSYTINRLYSLGQGISQGAQKLRPPSPQLGQDTPSTYVPTKMEISITLLPMQSRKDVSQLFSVAEFANGNLLKGGFW